MKNKPEPKENPDLKIWFAWYPIKIRDKWIWLKWMYRMRYWQFPDRNNPWGALETGWVYFLSDCDDGWSK